MAHRILLVGGGSGGHVYPLMAVAGALRKKAEANGINLELMVMGEGQLLADACAQNGLKYKLIAAGKYRRYFSLLNVLDVFKLPLGIVQSLWHLFWFMPDAVFAKGGYASVLPALAARLYLIPVVIHESDSVPGLANRFLSHFARAVLISFHTAQKFFPKKTVYFVGNPIRTQLLAGDRASALSFFQLRSDIKTVLVLGGSQGAKQINDLILSILVQLSREYQIIHQCGPGQHPAVQAELDRVLKEGEGKYAEAVRSNYRLYPFFNDQEIAMAYAAADIIISRAGAGSIFEIAALGKPVIVIPLQPSAGNHQFYNAIEFSHSGAVVIEGTNMTPAILENQLHALLVPEKVSAVGAQIRTFAVPDSADKIADIFLSTG